MAENVKFPRHRFLLRGLIKLADEIGGKVGKVADEDSSP